NGIKRDWNFIKQDWEYDLICHKVALKEIKDSRYDMTEFFKVYLMTVKGYAIITNYFGISKNPSTQNYIIVTDLLDDGLHNFLTKNFLNLGWRSKIYILASIAEVIEILHAKNLVHCDLHSGNILINNNLNLTNSDLRIDMDSCKLENDLQELFELFLCSSMLHPQSCYISRYINTLHGLHDLLEEIKSGKISDPNLLLKSNE
ncbi:1273_t:CDS:2, partial [Diversispora eburnea]